MRIEMSLTERLKLNKLVAKKQQEFQQAGYLHVSPQAIWDYFTEYRWVKKLPADFAGKAAEITALTANDFFDYQRIQAQVKESQQFDWQHIDDLF